MVSDKMLSKLKVIIKEEYGRDLSNSEVSSIGNGIVRYLKALIHLKISKSSKNK